MNTRGILAAAAAATVAFLLLLGPGARADCDYGAPHPEAPPEIGQSPF